VLEMAPCLMPTQFDEGVGINDMDLCVPTCGRLGKIVVENGLFKNIKLTDSMHSEEYLLGLWLRGPLRARAGSVSRRRSERGRLRLQGARISRPRGGAGSGGG